MQYVETKYGLVSQWVMDNSVFYYLGWVYYEVFIENFRQWN